MASLITRQGPNVGRRFPLTAPEVVVGRQPDAEVYLESLAVSRQHARIACQSDTYTVEDLGSSNGTYLNGSRIRGRVALKEGDALQIGPYIFDLRVEVSDHADADHVIRATVDAYPSNQTLYAQNPAYKLQVVLDIAQHLGDTLELDQVLDRLLEQLLRLFPQADRGLVLLQQGETLVVAAQRSREKGAYADFPYSRTVVGRALEDGVGLLSEDVGRDEKLEPSATLVSLNLRSFLCVPLITREGKRRGVIQLDCLRQGRSFRQEDLEVLTALALEVAVVLENASLHAEVLKEERLRQEVMMARDIQQSFLPNNFHVLKENNPDLYAQVQPAREVSGDLYDFFPLPDGRLGFFLGDVSGKGMPAALFMIMVRTLARHLAPARGAAEFVQRLNNALVADNPTSLFVTLAYGIYDGRDGSVLLASGGHPPPLFRRADGSVTEVTVKQGLLLGYAPRPQPGEETRLVLTPGDTLILYTDGLVEATAPDGRTEYGVAGLSRSLGGPRTGLALPECARAVCADVQAYTQQPDLQDDQTMLLLRRPREEKR